MIRFAPLALFALAACAAAAEDAAPTGVNDTRQYPLANFDSVALKGPDSVIVQTGKAFAVSATGDTAALDRLDIAVKGNRLEVGRKREGMDLNWGKNAPRATITVTLPALAGASVAGSGDMTVDTARGPRFAGAVAGSGDLAIASVEADQVDLSVAGSGDLRLAGRAKNTKASIAGSGDIDAGALAAETAKISIAGSGGIRAGVSTSADISIAGSGDVEIVGNATCTISRIGSGDVRCTPTGASAAN